MIISLDFTFLASVILFLWGYELVFIGAGTSQSVPPANTPVRPSQPAVPGTRGNPGRLSAAISPSILEEHSRVFHYTKGKTRTTGKGKAPSKKIPICTIKFSCLGFVDIEKPPTTVAAKTALANSGLGPSNISFDIVYLHSADIQLSSF